EIARARRHEQFGALLFIDARNECDFRESLFLILPKLLKSLDKIKWPKICMLFCGALAPE
ncbi:MAG: hypothetical protein ACPGZU_10190, partial [Ketobacter sp.]